LLVARCPVVKRGFWFSVFGFWFKPTTNNEKPTALHHGTPTTDDEQRTTQLVPEGTNEQ
jgi:hypothetical protein